MMDIEAHRRLVTMIEEIGQQSYAAADNIVAHSAALQEAGVTKRTLAGLVAAQEWAGRYILQLAREILTGCENQPWAISDDQGQNGPALSTGAVDSACEALFKDETGRDGATWPEIARKLGLSE